MDSRDNRSGQSADEHILRMRQDMDKAIAVLAMTSITGSEHLASLWDQLDQLPANTPLSRAIPHGRFWIIGPNKHGLCYAFRLEAGDTLHILERVSIHRYQDLITAQFRPIRVIAQVER